MICHEAAVGQETLAGNIGGELNLVNWLMNRRNAQLKSANAEFYHCAEGC